MSKVWILAVVSFVLALPSRADAQFFFERFDSYAVGSQICGVGGWECWDLNPAANTTVVNTQSFSPSNSLLIAGTADIVHQFTGINTGTWHMREWVFIPSTQTGESWFILLNTYNPGGPYNWSAQIVFCRTGCSTAGVVPGMVSSIGGSEITAVGTTPLIMDQWVEIRAQINFTTNRYQVFYNGVQFYDQPWTVAAPVNLAAVDLFSNGSSNTFMDSVWLDQSFPVTGMSFSVE
jgi:hypothetical protein